MIALSPGMRRTNGRAGALALALCVAGSGSGCSYLFVDAPPARVPQPRPFTCTTSNSWPTIDVVLSGISVLEGIGALTSTVGANGSVSNSDRTADYVGAGVAAASAALFAASAAAGYRHTAECREATAELMNRLYLNQPGGPPSPFAPPSAALPQPYDPWIATAAPVQPGPPAEPAAVAPPAVAPPHAPDAPPAAGPGDAPPPAPPASDAEVPR
jgi:hypothetical protein